MATEKEFNNLVSQYAHDVDKATEKYQVLKDLDLFVMDNSIRESTVGQLRGHTLENKWQIYNESKKCGFKNMIVASFSHMPRVDDVFVKQLVERGEDRSGLFGFSEITNSIHKRLPETETVPVGLQKMKEGGLWHIIFEMDLGDKTYNFYKFTLEDMMALMKKWITWCHDELHEESKVFVSFRDLPDTMPHHADRCFQMVQFFATLPERIRPYGLMFEEPRGQSLPEECGHWAKYIRKIMDLNEWKAHLLVHVHQKFDLCEATALEVLMNGANGIWASVCTEGASLGNASSCVTILNLVRLGNKKVLKKFNCRYLRRAAINVTKITTGLDPPDKQAIYGQRALDFVFDLKPEDFDLADFFDEEAPVRISTIASAEMVHNTLVKTFGDDEQFTIEMATNMQECIKEEYMSAVGLAVLFERAGGTITEAMTDVIEKMALQESDAEKLIAQVRKIWDTWDLKDDIQGDDLLEYESFYNGFMAPFFACYNRCFNNNKALQTSDMDADNQIDWSEFMVYLKWALRQYPNIRNSDELLYVAFLKGIIPAMRNELQKKKRGWRNKLQKKKRAPVEDAEEAIHDKIKLWYSQYYGTFPEK